MIVDGTAAWLLTAGLQGFTGDGPLVWQLGRTKEGRT